MSLLCRLVSSLQLVMGSGEGHLECSQAAKEYFRA